MIDLRPLGDRAFLARFALESEARRWAEAVRSGSIPGVVDVAVAYASAAVFADPERLDPDELEAILGRVEPIDDAEADGRLIRLPVLYDGEDLAEVARLVGLAEGDVIRRHASRDYMVFAIGFLPGFPYAGYLPEPLAGLPRRKSPRARVPAGSVAIAGRQTGVYPAESPGGWLLLGRTPLKVVDLGRGHFPIRPGDRLRFEPIESVEFLDRLGEPLGAGAIPEPPVVRRPRLP
jgi:KipI family sensor histidine kinase inhibitor